MTRKGSMNTSNDLPDIERPDAGLALVSEWTLTDRASQHAAVDASVEAWSLVDWPDGLLSHTVLAAAKASTVRHYSQWAGPEALDRYRRGPAWLEAVEAAAGSLERHGLATFELDRSHHTPAHAQTDPGCVVVVDVALTEPSPNVQRQWVSAVLAALAVESPDGLLAAHFHASTDHTRIVNYAEWTTAQAHVDALDTGTPGSIGEAGHPEWERVRNFPGIADLSRFTRYTRWRTALPPTDEADRVDQSNVATTGGGR